MAEQIFLENVGTLYARSAIGTLKTWEVHHLGNDPTIPPLIYVVESEVGQRFLLGRGISGRPKFNMVRYIAKSLVEPFFEQLKTKDLSQYLILAGVHPFDLQYAIGCASPYDIRLLPTGFIKPNGDPGKDGAEVRGQNLIGEYKGETWLIPDPTIVSGLTVASFLRIGFEHHLPKQVYVFAASGSLEGIQRIYQECRKKDVELIPVFSQCIFEVSKGENLPGFPRDNLSIISPGSMTTQVFYEKALNRYQGTCMCSIGDLRESFDDTVQYSIQTLREMQVLGMDPSKEDWGAWTVNVRNQQFQQKVSDFNPALHDYFKNLWEKEL